MGYHVDLKVLESVVDELDTTQARLEKQLGELDRIVGSLAHVWTGRAATAYRTAHREWRADASDMHQALTIIHGAAHTAHANYTSATSTNVRMWDQVR
jgi:WXG100 family type VII secretion target